MPKEAIGAPQAIADTNDLVVRLLKQRKFPAATIAAKRGLCCMPNSPELWTNLGACLWAYRDYDGAFNACKRALELNANHITSLHNIALLYELSNQTELAEETYHRVLELDPTYLDAKWDLSLVRLGTGRLSEGFSLYDTRIERNINGAFPAFKLPRWNGECLEGKSILIPGEQGYGDTILFSRFLPWIASPAIGAKVVVCVTPIMVALLWEFRHLVEFIPENVPLPDVDYYICMGSLPHFYDSYQYADPPPPRLSLATIPSDPGRIARRIDQQMKMGPVKVPDPGLEPAFKIGICWTGSAKQQRNNERSVPFEMLTELAGDPRVWLYSLQVDPGASATIIDAGMDELVLDLSGDMAARGLVGTGTVIREMDLVITICTSVAHLAGAMGVPCWVLLCTSPYWVWMYGDGDSSPWYPHVKLFRQKRYMEWRPVIDAVKVELAALLAKRFDGEPTIEFNAALKTDTLY